MYASAMKFCGAMELCGIGWPRGESLDHSWPEVLAQVAAQKAGIIVAITRDHKPEEAELMVDKGFAPIYKFVNPRTSNVGCVWIKDMTGAASPVTKLPVTVSVAASASTLQEHFNRLDREREPPAPLPYTIDELAAAMAPPRMRLRVGRPTNAAGEQLFVDDPLL